MTWSYPEVSSYIGSDAARFLHFANDLAARRIQR
jgi:hypothetical protein